MRKNILLCLLILAVTGVMKAQPNKKNKNNTSGKKYLEEKHFGTVRQLTFGGDNAEAYWSFDDKKLVFQATNSKWNTDCDQIFIYDLAKTKVKHESPPLVSTGQGRTTCSYFLPGDTTILYASTHVHDAACPHKPPREIDGNYVWPIYDSYDIFVASLDGKIIKQLTDNPGYDAEATVSPKGDKIVFTSLRTGDPELFTMNLDGSEVRQVTRELGYDGGAFFHPMEQNWYSGQADQKLPKKLKNTRIFWRRVW